MDIILVSAEVKIVCRTIVHMEYVATLIDPIRDAHPGTKFRNIYSHPVGQELNVLKGDHIVILDNGRAPVN
jgi:hypothetical protein